MTSTMSSTKPYLVRAFYEWISDNQMTPYIVVDVSVYGVSVPLAYVNGGQIILNISLGAVGAISMAGEYIEFSARFGGKLENLTIPYGAISAIYAKENGAGTSLEIEHPSPEEITEREGKAPSPLTAVDTKSAEKAKAVTEAKPIAEAKPVAEIKPASEIKQATESKPNSASNKSAADKKSKTKGRASLKVIK